MLLSCPVNHVYLQYGIVYDNTPHDNHADDRNDINALTPEIECEERARYANRYRQHNDERLNHRFKLGRQDQKQKEQADQ